MNRVIFLAAVVLAACAPRPATPTFEARDAWARPADSAGTTAIYAVFVNRDTVPVTITSREACRV